MRGCLFILVAAVIAGALLVGVGLPAFAAGALTAGVGAAGLDAADTTVTVISDPPTDLVGLHADEVRIRATHATFRGLEIGSIDVTLTDVALVDRSAATVDGRLDDVVVEIAGEPLELASIALSGGGTSVIATTTVDAAAARTLILGAVAGRFGAAPGAVTLASPDRLTVGVGVDVHGRFVATSTGDLVVRVLDGPAAGDEIVLLRGGRDLPVRITGVTVTPGGALRLVGELTAGLLG